MSELYHTPKNVVLMEYVEGCLQNRSKLDISIEFGRGVPKLVMASPPISGSEEVAALLRQIADRIARYKPEDR